MAFSSNNLPLNTNKNKQLILDFRKGRADHHQSVIVDGDCVEIIHSFKFLGIHISNNLSWSTNTTDAVKRAQQHLHFLHVLKKYNPNCKLMLTFYCSTIESIITYSLTAWYAGCSAADKKSCTGSLGQQKKE